MVSLPACTPDPGRINHINLPNRHHPAVSLCSQICLTRVDFRNNSFIQNSSTTMPTFHHNKRRGRGRAWVILWRLLLLCLPLSSLLCAQRNSPGQLLSVTFSLSLSRFLWLAFLTHSLCQTSPLHSLLIYKVPSTNPVPFPYKPTSTPSNTGIITARPDIQSGRGAP
ncbi:hypothetical protein BJX63DRAFT_277558 [Aspergillus granulosus]|uniref:Uncharacterized protein n=1 Tax=Aspergillus granulosus TaxID=176169 RepID=A0ABR4H796_9EURO